MSTPPAAVDRRSGLANVIDIIVSPGTAFERLRVVPQWFWAFVVATLLGIAGFLLMSPAELHAFDKTGAAIFAATPQVAKLPADQQAAVIAQQMKIGRALVQVEWIFVPLGILIGGLIAALIMLIANAVSRGDGSFKKFFALAVTVQVVGGLGLLLTGIIVLVRGVDSFETSTAVKSALPSLALLAPGASSKLVAFLGVLSIATLWTTALTALGMIAVAHVKPAVAWTFAIAMLLVSAAIAGLATP